MGRYGNAATIAGLSTKTVTLVTIAGMLIDADLTHIGWFRHQPEALRAAMLAQMRPVSLAAGQTAYLEGDGDTGLWLVRDGLLRLELPVDEDRAALIGLMPGGSVFGRSRMGGAASRIVSARAARPTRALLLPDRAMERIAADHPQMWRALAQVLHGQLDAALVALAQQLTLAPLARVAARLLQFAQADAVPLAQADLGELTGLSRKAVNAHLATLERLGLIARGYRRIILRDRAALMRHAR